MGMISPLSSATGMKRSGPMSPWSGCCQRMRASTPTVEMSEMSTTGW